MISQLTEKGVRVPGGFATTADAYRAFLAHNGLNERISAALAKLDVEDVSELARVGKEIRQWILDTPFPEQLDAEIEAAWDKMVTDADGADISVAVRSSATAEDLPDASFAYQQETFLNINGLDNVKKRCATFSPPCTTTAPFPTASTKASNTTSSPFPLGCSTHGAFRQRRIRCDVHLDTESGYNQVVFVTSSYGLGENVVQGAVNPDEFYVFKPTLKASKPAILRKTMGSKHIKMIFTDKAEV